MGLGAKEELDTQIRGCSTIIPLGDWETDADENARGAPQGTVQGCRVGNTCAMPLIHTLNRHYVSRSADILRSVLLGYVDDTIAIVTDEPGDGERIPQAAQGILVDAATYSWAIHQIDNPHKNIQYYSDGEDQMVCLPT